jgi:hypothetical protein
LLTTTTVCLKGRISDSNYDEIFLSSIKTYIFKKAYDSSRREVLCNILIEFGIPVKMVRLIKEEDGLSPLLFNLALEYAIWWV